MSGKAVGGIVSCVAALTMIAATAYGQASGRTWTRSPDQGPPGTNISVSGAGCVLNGHATEGASAHMTRIVTNGGPPFETHAAYAVNADGTWGGGLTVPADAPAGDYAMNASCTEGDQVLDAEPRNVPFRVLAGGAATGATSTTTTTVRQRVHALPRTGRRTSPLIATGVWLVTFGALLVKFARRPQLYGQKLQA